MKSFLNRCGLVCLLLALPVLLPVPGLAIDIDISGSDATIEDTQCFLMENIGTPIGTGWARFCWNNATNMFYPVEYGFGMVHLQADFNDKTIDAPIGTGGAAVGEPVSVSPTITAIVRAEPMPTPSLEIQDNDDYAVGSARFEFLGSAEITTGKVAVSADLWFHELAPGFDFFIYIREQGSSAKKFGDLRFSPNGDVTLTDTNGYSGNIGTYDTGRVYPVKYEFDMDAGTYDVYLDGVLTVDDRAHGVVDRGVGAVLFGCSHDSDYDGYFNVDNIFVREIP